MPQEWSAARKRRAQGSHTDPEEDSEVHKCFVWAAGVVVAGSLVMKDVEAAEEAVLHKKKTVGLVEVSGAVVLRDGHYEGS